jgi:hypothetical protein
MATQDDVRRIAAGLPETDVDDGEQFGVSVRAGAKSKGLAWEWRERIHPKQPKVPNPDVLGVRVANGEEKQMLLDADPDVYFTEPHYNGFPAVLVRLAAIDVDELTELIVDAWRCQAPKKLVRDWDARRPAG